MSACICFWAITVGVCLCTDIYYCIVCLPSGGLITWTPVVIIIIIPVFKLPAAEFITSLHFSCQKNNHLHSSISILFSSWTTCRPTRHNKTLMQTQPTLTLTLTVATVMLRSMHQVNRNLVWRNILMIDGKHLLLLAIVLSALARFGGLDSLLDKIYNLNASHDIFHYYLTFWGSFKWSTNQTRTS